MGIKRQQGMNHAVAGGHLRLSLRPQLPFPSSDLTHAPLPNKTPNPPNTNRWSHNRLADSYLATENMKRVTLTRCAYGRMVSAPPQAPSPSGEAPSPSFPYNIGWSSMQRPPQYFLKMNPQPKDQALQENDHCRLRHRRMDRSLGFQILANVFH